MSGGGNGSAREVFLAFLQQGCVSFGGPVAHLGYFRKEFVERRGWLSEGDYAGLVALCQFLPGPASSQVGMALGHRRAGWWGALAAWVGFTFPSALLMYLAAVGLPLVGAGGGWLIGVKLVAVAVVTQAVWQMARNLAPGGLRAVMALAAAAFSLLIPGFGGQIGAILLGALAGWLFLREADAAKPDETDSKGFALPKVALACLVAFAALLLAAFAFSGEGAFGLFSSFYRSGALVFGGGHVVLPFLEAESVGREVMERDTFIAGYGLAQALPGPLFAFSTFLGSAQEVSPGGASWGLLGGLIALLAIFLPGALLLFGALPIWDWLKERSQVRAALAGINAAVVGLLLAVLYDPLWTSAVTTPLQFAVFLGLAALLFVVRWPAWAIVLVGAAVGAVIL